MAFQNIEDYKAFLFSVIILLTFSSQGGAMLESKTCSTLSETFSKLTQGVDITSVSLTPLIHRLDTGFKAPVFNFSCNEERFWTNPETRKRYRIPDQFWKLTTYPDTWISPEVNIFQHHSQLTDDQAQQLGVTDKPGSFVKSPEFQYKSQILNKSEIWVEVSAIANALEISLVPTSVHPLPVNQFFDKDVELLPKMYINGSKLYNEFLDVYGTHYFQQATFGFGFKFGFKLMKELAQKQTEADLTHKAKTLFYYWLKRDEILLGDIPLSEIKHINSAGISSVHASIFGGKVTTILENGVKSWSRTVWDYLRLVSGKLRPISDLISDEEKKAAINEAIEERLNVSFLFEFGGRICRKSVCTETVRRYLGSLAFYLCF